MRVLKYLLFTLSSIFILGCERDDICAEGTPTTPLLIIKFIDFDNGTEIKAPSELQVKAVAVDMDVEDPFPLGSVTDSILIPLRTNSSITDYELTIDSNTTNEPETPANTDVISIQYTTVEEYVSSACGFKINYEGLTISPPVAGDDGSWIKNITIQREDVTDETTAHVFIFH
ncbi:MULTISPECIES: DUF6452 family protein [Aquimarina]|uniref:Lipoprotein n=1 Tax=Aquimarina algiphila TaxID=2047982 RepID=A0A554VKL6_9FLAO|nr:MULTISPECIES: DUF6452 family protein [Aquimarina]TSE08551.1 hypothetical protein FOF46_12325 [Aquimarina algiphila]